MTVLADPQTAAAAAIPAQQTPARVGGKLSRLESLTGLRFIFAYAIVATHLAQTSGGRVHDLFASTRVAELGWTGVSYFFVLSGFLLTLGARPTDTRRNFLRRRAARIYPAYALSLVAAALVGHFAFGTTITHRHWAEALLLVQAWSPHPGTYFAVNNVAWSLSVEAFLYLAWVVVVPWAVTLSRPARLRLLAGLVAAVVAINVYGSVMVPASEFGTIGGDHHWQGWLVYICPVSRLPEFLVGAVLATLMKEGWRPRWGFRRALGLLAVVWLLAQIRPIMADMVLLPFISAVGLVLAGAMTDLGQTRSWLRNSRLVWLGGASYCVYLFHEDGIGLFLRRVPTPTGATCLLYAAAVSAFALAVAALVHEGVEMPAERRLKGTRPATTSARAARS